MWLTLVFIVKECYKVKAVSNANLKLFLGKRYPLGAEIATIMNGVPVDT